MGQADGLSVTATTWHGLPSALWGWSLLCLARGPQAYWWPRQGRLHLGPLASIIDVFLLRPADASLQRR